MSPAAWGHHSPPSGVRVLRLGGLCTLCLVAGAMLGPHVLRTGPARSALSPSVAPLGRSPHPGTVQPAAAPTVPPGGYPEVVASHDLAATTLITGSDAVTRSFTVIGTSHPLQSGTFSSLQALDAYVLVAQQGRYLIRALPADEPVHRADLGDLGGRTNASLSLTLPAGFEAESVSVPPLQSADGTVVAGDHVDVLLTLSTDQLVDNRPPDQSPGPEETQQLLQNVPVVRADPPVYTLLVRPQDALLLKYVKDSQNATLELVLRSSQNRPTVPVHTLPIMPDYFTWHLTSDFAPRPATMATASGASAVSPQRAPPQSQGGRR